MDNYHFGAVVTPVFDKRELRERCKNFTEKEKWKFLELFEQHKDLLLSPDRKPPHLVQLKKDVWQNIANQLNTDPTCQPRTVVQIQQLWKNLTCRAKGRLTEIRNEHGYVEESEISATDAKVLSIHNGFNSSTFENVEESSSTPKDNKETLDWEEAIKVIKSEDPEDDNEFNQSSSSTLPQVIAIDRTPLPVEKEIVEQCAVHPLIMATASNNCISNDSDVKIFTFELFKEKRATLIAKRAKIDAKLKQIETKNRLHQTEIDANLAKKVKYEEEAKHIRLKNLELLRSLKNNGFAFDTNGGNSFNF